MTHRFTLKRWGSSSPFFLVGSVGVGSVCRKDHYDFQNGGTTFNYNDLCDQVVLNVKGGTHHPPSTTT